MRKELREFASDRLNGGASPAGTTPRSEADRIVQMARIRWKSGDAAGAQQLLKHLRAVIVGDSEHPNAVRTIDRLLASIRDQRGTYQRAFIREALDRAQRLANDERDQADGIWSAIIQLYQDDLSLRDLVEEAKSQKSAISREPQTDQAPGKERESKEDVEHK